MAEGESRSGRKKSSEITDVQPLDRVDADSLGHGGALPREAPLSSEQVGQACVDRDRAAKSAVRDKMILEI